MPGHGPGQLRPGSRQAVEGFDGQDHDRPSRSGASPILRAIARSASRSFAKEVVRAQGEENAPPGTDPGAPTVPHLGAKLIWTTSASGVVWAICAVVYAKGLITLDGLASLFGFPAQNR